MKIFFNNILLIFFFVLCQNYWAWMGTHHRHCTDVYIRRLHAAPLSPPQSHSNVLSDRTIKDPSFSSSPTFFFFACFTFFYNGDWLRYQLKSKVVMATHLVESSDSHRSFRSVFFRPWIPCSDFILSPLFIIYRLLKSFS